MFSCAVSQSIIAFFPPIGNPYSYFYHCRLILFPLELCINGIKDNVIFCNWLPSLKIMPVRLILAVAYINIFLLLCSIFIVWIYHLFLFKLKMEENRSSYLLSLLSYKKRLYSFYNIVHQICLMLCNVMLPPSKDCEVLEKSMWYSTYYYIVGIQQNFQKQKLQVNFCRNNQIKLKIIANYVP